MQKPAKFFAFTGVIVGSLLLVAVLVVNKWALVLTSRVYELPDHMLASGWHVNNDAATVARGAHLVDAVLGCAECHGDDMAGKTLVHDKWFGTITSANLTEHARTDSDADWVRAVRYGLRSDGRGLWLMPQPAYSTLSDNDLAAVIAYMRSLRTVHRDSPSHRLAPYGRLLVAMGKTPLVHVRSRGKVAEAAASPPMEPADDATYGRYWRILAAATRATVTTCRARRRSHATRVYPPATSPPRLSSSGTKPIFFGPCATGGALTAASSMLACPGAFTPP